MVSNPPYVAYREADKVQKSVREFEPLHAVFAGVDGLDVISRLVEQAQMALKPGGWLAVEIGYSMREEVVALLQPTVWQDVRVVPDLQGIPRVIAAEPQIEKTRRDQAPGGSFRLAVGIGLRLSTLCGPSGKLLKL